MPSSQSTAFVFSCESFGPDYRIARWYSYRSAREYPDTLLPAPTKLDFQ